MPCASFIKQSNSGIELVYDQGVPTETSNYTVLINNIRAAKPDAVVELGYAPNDIAFLRNLSDSGVKFKFLFCIYPGLETELLEKNVGAAALGGVFTYVPSSEIAYRSEFGMDLQHFKAAWNKAYGDGKVEFGFNSVAGYTTGLVLEKALADRRQSRPARVAQGDLRPLRQAQDARRHLRARRRRGRRSARSRRSASSSRRAAA